jgi:hypothetical protein
MPIYSMATNKVGIFVWYSYIKAEIRKFGGVYSWHYVQETKFIP